MDFLQLLRGIGILLLLQGMVQGAPVFAHSVKFLSISTEHNPVYYSNVTSWIANGTLNLGYTLLKEINYGLRGFIDIQYKIADSKRHQSLFSYDFDVCKLMNEVVKENLLRVWFQNAYKYGNLMQNCPIAAGQYYMRDLIFESSSVPVYLRSGLYRLIGTVYVGKRTKKISKQVFRFRVTPEIQIL